MKQIGDLLNSEYDIPKRTYKPAPTWFSMVCLFYKKVNDQNKFDGFPLWDIGVFKSDMAKMTVSDMLGWYQDCEKSPNFAKRYKILRKSFIRPKKWKQSKLFELKKKKK